MDQPILEAEPVDERLERRTGRAHRLRHVHLAGARDSEIIGGGDAREHLASRIVDCQDRDREVGSERPGALAGKLFEALLQRRIDGQAMQAAAGRGSHHGVGRVWSEHWHRLAAFRHALKLRARDVIGGH